MQDSSAALAVAAFDLPGHSLYLSNPHRLSILSIGLNASTTIAAQPPPPVSSPTLFSSPGFQRSPSFDGSPNPNDPGAAAGVEGPPSAYRLPDSQQPQGRYRPRSADLGARARGAILEFSRAARGAQGGGRGNAVALADVANSLAPQASARAGPRAFAGPGESSTAGMNASVKATTETSVRPHSFTFAQDGRLTSHTVPLDITASSTLSGLQGAQPDTAPDPLVEFVADPTPPLDLTSVSPRSSTDSEADVAGPSSAPAQTVARKPFDPTRLLLKVSPPAPLARDLWIQSGAPSGGAGQVTEQHSVQLSFRLRLCASAGPLPSFSGSIKRSGRDPNSSAPTTLHNPQATFPRGPPGPERDRERDPGLGQVLFVSADSAQKLVSALASAGASPESGPLATEQEARLEGISRVVVNPLTDDRAAPRGARDCDFDWTWQPLGRGQVDARASGNGAAAAKCCCAFVEIEPGSGKANVLAAFSFWVDMPSTLSNPGKAGGGAGGFSPRGASGRPDTPSVIAGLDAKDYILYGGASPQQGGRRRTSWRRSALSSPSANRKSQDERNSEPFPAMSPNLDGVRPAALDLDHTEITLEDVENDSPILRAAIANLERRTSTLKKACKTVAKIAADVRYQLISLQSAQTALDDALLDLGTSAPSTIQQLSRAFLTSARGRMYHLRQEEVEMLERHVEKPMQRVIELCKAAQEQGKSFDGESKTYYSQTQKWLANRVVPASQSLASTSTVAMSTPTGTSTDKMAKQERADEKQKIRQLRFELARLDLYRTMSYLHGGDAELELFQEMLALAAWHADGPRTLWGPNWPSQAAQTALTSFGAGVSSASRQSVDQRALTDARREDAEAKLTSAETALGLMSTRPSASALADENTSTPAQLGGTGSTWDLLGMQQQACQDAEPSSSGKHPGHKIKNLFNSLAMGSSHSFQGAVQGDVNTTPPKGGNGVKRKVSLKLATKPTAANVAGGLTSPVLGAFHRFRGSADTTTPTMTTAAMAQAPPSSPGLWAGPSPPRSAVDLASSPYVSGVSGSPPMRSKSAVNGGSPAKKPTELGHVASPRLPQHCHRSSSDGMTSFELGHHRKSSGLGLGLGVGLDVENGMGDTISPLGAGARNAVKNADLSGAAAANQGRKKEGILWAMSKPVSGPGGSDTPRGVKWSASWRECWIVLSGSGHLGEYADWKDAKVMEPSNPLIDLRFATVREARGVDRRFTFEVVTRDSRRFFQAPDEAAMRDWIAAISRAIESLLNGTSSVRQIDKVARSSEQGPSDDFGTGGGLRAFGISQPKAFSQSLTDVSSTARLFHRPSDASRKRDSAKGAGSAHLSTLSEGDSGPPTRPLGMHERGISNKTPVSGYVLNENLNGSSTFLMSTAQTAPNLNLNIGQSQSSSSQRSSDPSVLGDLGDLDFDRRIEEMVHSSFGGSLDLQHGRRGSAPSLPPVVMAGGGAAAAVPMNSSAHGHGQATSSTKVSRAAEIERIARRPENASCADCKAAEPRWASWALGGQPCCIFICIDCSGVHRGLGVQTSKVKSVNLDDWTEEQLEAARMWGNARANAYWENLKPANALPRHGDTSFWKTKYVKRAWAAPGGLPLPSSASAPGPASGSGSGQAERRSDSVPSSNSLRLSTQTDTSVNANANPNANADTSANANASAIGTGQQSSAGRSNLGVPSLATLSDVSGGPPMVGTRASSLDDSRNGSVTSSA